MRRLTEEQYRRTIADVFAPDIEVVGRFEPDSRRDGLLAVGTAWVTVTPAGFEQYEAMARGIAAQVVSPAHREHFLPCAPANAAAPDSDCVAAIVESIGPRLLRRPIAAEEVDERVVLAEETTQKLGDFYRGAEFALVSLLVSPEFLFRVERGSPIEDRPDRLQLTNHTIASRLSFFLWNTTPDEALLAAAGRGELTDPEGLARQVDRLLSSPRLIDGVRAYFSDVLGFDELDAVSKDTTLYPRYSRKILDDAREQTLRVVADHLIDRQADYRDLFTTRQSFMTRNLGLVYGVPVRPREGWESMEFPAGHPRAGLLSHVSLLTLHSHPGRSSATLRGIFVREALLCQEVPAAPADVDFTVVQDVDNPEFQTARDRLTAHRTAPGCKSCHKLMDPLGLGLENFDGIGMWRGDENGAAIDASGQLDGEPFADAAGLGRALRDSPVASACAVEKLFRYAVGRPSVRGERGYLRDLTDRFAAAGYRFPELMRTIATSDSFSTASELRSVPSERGRET